MLLHILSTASWAREYLDYSSTYMFHCSSEFNVGTFILFYLSQSFNFLQWASVDYCYDVTMFSIILPPSRDCYRSSWFWPTCIRMCTFWNPDCYYVDLGIRYSHLQRIKNSRKIRFRDYYERYCWWYIIKVKEIDHTFTTQSCFLFVSSTKLQCVYVSVNDR